MTPQIRPGKRAQWHHLQMFQSREGCRCLNELTTNPPPFETRRHFGMNHDETAVALIIRKERHHPFGVHLELVMRCVVRHVHG